MANLNPVTTLLMAIVIYVFYQISIKVFYEIKFIKCFGKLPQLPFVGLAGWLLGNIDMYVYAMRHLNADQGIPFSKYIIAIINI